MNLRKLMLLMAVLIGIVAFFAFDLGRFFKRTVHSTAELDFNAALEPFGLRLTKKLKTNGSEENGGATPWLGVETETKDGLLAIKHVYDGSPAREAGLDAGDVILALDGYRVGPSTFKNRLRSFRPGRAVEVTFFRRDMLRQLTLVLAKTFELEYRIEPLAQSLARAQKISGDGKPVVLLDHYDNSASGGTMDTMAVLGAILDKGLEGVAAFAVHDPQAVQQMIQAGVGAEVTIALGGKYDLPSIKRKGEPKRGVP